MATSSAAVPSRAGQPLRLHQRCELTSYGRGEILFVGQTSFSHGIWVGVALDQQTGKHDGVVQGKRYFAAHTGHGIFVRSSQVHVLPDEEQQGDEDEGQDAVAEQYIDSPPTEDARSTASRPATAARQAASRTAQVSSRASMASTRSASPSKPVNVRGRMSGMTSGPGAAAATAIFGGVGARQQQQASSSTTASRASPFKTPARPSMTPRTSTAASRTTTTASSAKAAGPSATSRTPLATRTAASTAARVPATTSRAALTQARSAVQAGRAPDTATARAGLRPIAKTRTSIAPSTSSTAGIVSSNPRTPARSTATTARVPQTTVPRRAPASITPIASARPAAVSQTTPRTGGMSSSTRSSRPILSDGGEEEGEEDLMAMSIEDAEESGHSHELYDGEGEAISSPSLRKAGMSSQPDHMSLSRGPSTTLLARTTAEYAALQREVDELRARVRIAEKKREEEREKVREAERVQQESEQFLIVKPKMAAKQQELQDELKELHRSEREWTTQREEYERQIAELTDQVEILTLDKEMAEERAEGVSEELQTFKDRVEELELDMEVLREENSRYESGPVEEKDRLSVGYMQLEKQNERLKEALIRLRDLTAESDSEQKQRIAELERDLRALDELQASYESVCAKLEQSDALLEDLKIQLDDALGAEEMLEQLTERNMSLSEKLDEMRTTIEELEALKDLNDELEETHIETEKQLQEELDLKEMQMREHHVRNESLEANIVDYEATFGQFRELVLNLQSELEALRDNEKARDATRTAAGAEDQAMLNLNLKLQSSTLKSQAKTIDLEIGKLDAMQGKQQLAIISVYLPKRYFEQDKDAVESLLFFQRIATKTEIIKGVIESNNDIAGNLVGVVDERLLVICRMRHSLAHFMASSRQIAALIHLSSIPTFLKSGRMFKELTSVERKIDQFIDLLRREELKEEDCAQDYRRFVKMLEDFEFALLDGSSEAIDSDLAAKELGSASLFDLDLDTIAAALGFAKQNIAALYNDFNCQSGTMGETGDATSQAETEIEMRMNDLDIDQVLFTPLQDVINHIRSTKVPARKLLRRLSALYDNEEAVKMEAIVKLPGLGRLTSQLVAFASTLATSFSEYTNDVRTNKAPFELKDILAFVEEATREAMGSPSTESTEDSSVGRGAAAWRLTLGETSKLGQTVSDLLQSATEQDNVQKIAGTMPWLGRVEEMRQEQENNAESQRVIIKQTEDLRDMFKQIKVRDEVIEENRIKIERLGKQLQRSRQDNETVTELRDDLVDMTKRMKAYEEGNSALQGELEQLQRQYERALNEGMRPKDVDSSAITGGTKANGTQAEGTSAGLPGVAGTTAVGYTGPGSGFLPSGGYEVSYLVDQLEALRGVVKYLRLENSLLKGRDLLVQVDRLPALLPRLSRQDSGISLGSGAESDAGAEQKRGLPRSKKEGHFLGRQAGPGPHTNTPGTWKTGEEKRLVQDWMHMASSPRVVTLPSLKAKTDDEKSGTHRKPWMRMAQLPHVQYHEQVQQRARMRQRIEELQSKMGLASSGNGPSLALRV